jgi:antitoxin ParD1/3/4
MELTITPELEGLIQQKVDSGAYDTPQQVVENAVYRLNQDDGDFGWDPGELQAAIDEGWEEAERGEAMSGDEARQLLAEMRAARRRG